MPHTIAATGVGVGRDTLTVSQQALAMARSGLNGKTPLFGLLFASPSHPLPRAISVISEAFPQLNLIGCHTAGELTERGLVHGGVTLMLVASDETLATAGLAANVKADPGTAAATLCATAHDIGQSAKAKGFGYPLTLTLVDGLNGSGDELVSKMVTTLAPNHRIVGGAAGDEGAFKHTPVMARGEAIGDGAAALHLFSRKRFGVGVGHGLKPTTQKMRVTRAVKNVIHEIDGRPAFDIYREHAAARGIKLTPEGAGEYMIGNELGIFFFNELIKARAPLSAASDGALTCAAEVPQGASVCILDGEPSSMVAAAAQAAGEAKAALGDAPCAGVLLFDCICRGMILKEGFQAEIDSVRRVFGGEVPVAGFLTYGEIARYKGTLDGWHNTTAVVVAIPG